MQQRKRPRHVEHDALGVRHHSQHFWDITAVSTAACRIRHIKLTGTAVGDRGIARIARHMWRLTQIALGQSGTLLRVDLRSLKALRSIPRSFLASCTNLRLLT